MDRTNRKQTKLILGGVTIPCVTMVNEVIGMTIQGTQLLINTYFGDLSDVEIPQKYYFEMGGKPYSYSYNRAGRENVEEMKRLANNGAGLSAYITRNVRFLYD